jgi:hypothetical protein
MGRGSLYGKLNILEKANMFNDDLQPRQYTISSNWARKSRPSIVDNGAEARKIGSSRHKLLRYRGAMVRQWGTAKRRTYRLVPRDSGSGAPLQDGQQARAAHEAEHVKTMRTIGRFEATQNLFLPNHKAQKVFLSYSWHRTIIYQELKFHCNVNVSKMKPPKLYISTIAGTLPKFLFTPHCAAVVAQPYYL